MELGFAAGNGSEESYAQVFGGGYTEGTPDGGRTGLLQPRRLAWRARRHQQRRAGLGHVSVDGSRHESRRAGRASPGPRPGVHKRERVQGWPPAFAAPPPAARGPARVSSSDPRRCRAADAPRPTPAPSPPTAACSRSMSPGSPARLRSCSSNRHGRVLARRRADRLGAALFRNLTPGPGYRVRQRVDGRVASSAALRVLPDSSAPPSTAGLQPAHPDLGLRLPDHPRRHPTGHRRAPAVGRRTGALSDAGRVRRLRLRRSGRCPERDRPGGPGARLRRRRRQHARDRLLGRRL